MSQKGQLIELEDFVGHEMEVCMRCYRRKKDCRGVSFELWQKWQSLPQSSLGFRGT